jgi:hypothetical protein
MVTKCTCKKIGCSQYDVSIPDIQTLKATDGKGRVCSECGSPMIVAQSINTFDAGPRQWASGRARRR